MITLDFETYYDKAYSLSKMTTEAYIRDEQFEVIGVSVKVDDQPARWFSGPKHEIAQWLKQFDIEKQYLLCHHAMFDGAILAWHFGIKPKYYLDTLAMARPITGATVGGSLAALAKKFMLGEKGTEVVQALGKRREDFAVADLAAYGEYCKNDVQLTYLLYKVLFQFSTPKELYVIDLMTRMFTDPVLELDKGVLQTHLAGVQAKKQKLLDSLPHGMEDIVSNPKLALLLDKLGVEPPRKPSPAALKKGENTMTWAFGKTDKEFLALLEHPDPRVQTLVTARLGLKSTLEETRTEAFIGIADRGTLPIMLQYWGAHTGRASGGDKINLHNLPRAGALRRSMLAPEGHILLACDSSQIEARVVAWLAGQDDLVTDFRNGVDIYSQFASAVFGVPITKDDKVERFVGKTCILGLGYGMGPPKFQNTLRVGQGKISMHMDISECKRTVDLYRHKYQSIPALWREADRALHSMVNSRDFYLGVGMKLLCNGQGVHLPNGMLIRYENLRRTPDGYEYTNRYGAIKLYGGKLIENIVQALARIVVFDQMCAIEQKIRPMDSPEGRYRTVLTVHDEDVVVCPENAANAVKALMVDTMSSPPKWAPDLPVACELEMGKNYAECK